MADAKHKIQEYPRKNLVFMRYQVFRLGLARCPTSMDATMKNRTKWSICFYSLNYKKCGVVNLWMSAPPFASSTSTQVL
jgi:hypothetical protein